MLEIIMGRAGSGKTDEIYGRIKKISECGGKSILVVPEQFSHEAERELCAACGNSIGMSSEVLSFSRLYSRVAAETGGLSDRALDPGGRILLMDMALKSVSPMLTVYRLGRHRPDFLKRLLDTKDELTSARAGYDTLMNAGEMTGGTLTNKLSDLAAIFEAYDALVPENVTEPYDRLDILASRIAESSLSGEIFVDGFTDFTAQESEVLLRLLEKCGNLTVSLTCDGVFGTDTQFEIVRRTASQLIAMSNKAGTEYKLTEIGAGTPNSALGICKRYIFCDVKPDAPENTDGVYMYRADTIARECEKAASEAVRLVRDEGCRWRDITVSVSDWEKYRSVVPGIFGKYGVPIYTYDKEDILRKPIMSLITGVLNIICGGWEYSDVIGYLKTDMTGIDIAQRDILENYVYKWNIRGERMWCRDDDWTLPINGYDGNETENDKKALSDIDALRRMVSAPIFALSRNLKASEGAADKVKALYAFTEDIGLFDRISAKTEALKSGGDNQSAEEYAQLWGIFVNALEQCAGVLGDTVMDTDEFSRIFRLLLSQYEVGSIPAYIDAVGVGEITRMRRRNVKHMMILGASDDMLPSIAEGGGILSDSERDELEKCGIELSNTSHLRLARQMNAIYTAVNQQSESLTMVYSDRGGNARASFVFTEICSMLNITPKDIDTDIRRESLLPCFELAASGDGEARAYFMSDPDMREKLVSAVNAAKTPRGSLSHAGAMGLYGRDINMSASRIDKYKSCKFAYFMQYGLRAKPRTRAQFEAPEAGTFIHYILENSTRDIMSDGGFASISDEKVEETVRKYAEEFIKTSLDGFKDKSKRFIYLFNRLIGDAVSIVTEMAHELALSDFVPLDFELDFSNGGDLPPASVVSDDGSVSVRGKVDRVDGWVSGDKLYLRVVDYKTGRKEFSLSDVLRGIGLQMLIYLFVLREKGRIRYDAEIVPAGVLYMPAREVTLSMARGSSDEQIEKERLKNLRRHGLILDDKAVINAMEHGDAPKYIPVKFTSDGTPTGDSIADIERFGLLSRHIDSLLADIGSEIRSGDISADPYFKNSVDNACAYCDYFEACRFGDDRTDKPRYLTNLKAPQVWELLGKEDGR